MRVLVWLTLGCALFFSAADASQIAPGNSGPDYDATSAYYAGLISGDKPRLAEIVMFANMLPKGGDLHHHYSGAIYAETYLDWVSDKNYCINVYDDPKKAFTIADSAPQGPCLSVADIRRNEILYRELLQRWSDKDYENHNHLQSPPDKQFFDTFGYFGPVSGKAYLQGLQSLKARAVAENVAYLETMLSSVKVAAPASVATKINSLTSYSTQQQVDEVLRSVIPDLNKDKLFKNAVRDYVINTGQVAENLDSNNFRIRFQSYVSRNGTPADVFSGMYAAFIAATKGKPIVGVNIVGPENGVVALRDYGLHMKMFAFLKKKYPKVNVSMHAGELTLGMVPPESLKSHIREAVYVAGADRIGHGVDIVHESDAIGLLKTMRERPVPVEINLTSNAFILGVKDEAHPLSVYRSQHVPFVISTDDPGVSRNNLSGEYAIYISKYKPDYDELKKVVYNSILYSFLNEAERKEELAKLDKQFGEFERSIANLYPGPGKQVKKQSL